MEKSQKYIKAAGDLLTLLVNYFVFIHVLKKPDEA